MSLLADANAEEAAFLVAEMNRNRIESGEALDRIITLASADASLIPEAVAQIAASDSPAAAAIPLLVRAAEDPKSPPPTLAGAVSALSRSDSKLALPAMLAALVHLGNASDANKDLQVARKAFLTAPKLENHHLALESFGAANPGAPATL